MPDLSRPSEIKLHGYRAQERHILVDVMVGEEQIETIVGAVTDEAFRRDRNEFKSLYSDSLFKAPDKLINSYPKLLNYSRRLFAKASNFCSSNLSLSITDSNKFVSPAVPEPSCIGDFSLQAI